MAESQDRYTLDVSQTKPAFQRLIEDGDSTAANDLTRSEAEWCVAYMAGIAPRNVHPDNFEGLSRADLRVIAREMRNEDMESAGYGKTEEIQAENGDIDPENVSYVDDVPVDPEDYKSKELIDMAQEIGVSYQGTKTEVSENINTWFAEKTSEENSEEENSEDSDDNSDEDSDEE